LFERGRNISAVDGERKKYGIAGGAGWEAEVKDVGE
jgi:hypothetical protein